MRRGILAGRDELKTLKDRIRRKPFDAIYETLHKRCSLILETQPVTETQWRLLAQQGVWTPGATSARTAQGRMLDLLIAHHIEPNVAYRNRAIEELKNLCAWSAWSDVRGGEILADVCTAEAAVAAAVALDWLWEDLSEPDRLRVLKAIRTKAIEPYTQAVRKNAYWYNVYHHVNAVVNSGCGLAALALSDDDSPAREAYRLAREGLKTFFNALGREGGWDEGTGMWGHAMRYVLLLAEAAARCADDQSLYHSRGLDATGLFPIYFTPGGQAASFGDVPAVPLYGTLYLLAKQYGLREVAWWLDTYAFHRDVSTTGFSAAGLALLFRPVDVEVAKSVDLAPLKVFHEIGWSALADHWPRPSLYVAAKCGDLGASHSQHDMNSLQLQVDGEMLLTDLGHGPYSERYLSAERGEFYEVQACSHNTVVVGQRDHQIDAQGTVLEAQAGKDYRWVAMDGGTACGDSVSFVRHVVMLANPGTQAGECVLVLDDLNLATPERVDVLWHTLGQFQCDAAAQAGRIVGRQAQLCFSLAASQPMSLGVQSRVIDAGRAEQVLKVTLAGVGRVVSAMLLGRTPARVELHKAPAGGINVTFNGRTLAFKLTKRHLQLQMAR